MNTFLEDEKNDTESITCVRCGHQWRAMYIKGHKNIKCESCGSATPTRYYIGRRMNR